jgi:N-acyl-D-aspartate/D-glutamate deacylase
MLQKQGVGPNVACFAGHSAIRTFVMGEEATERTATDEEIGQMAAQVRQAMAAAPWASPPRPPRRTTARAARRCLAPGRRRELRALVNAMAESGAASTC